MASTCPPPTAPQEILMAINMGTQGLSTDSTAEEGPTTNTAPQGGPSMVPILMAPQEGLTASSIMPGHMATTVPEEATVHPTTSMAPLGDPSTLAATLTATPMAQQQGGLMEIPTELRGPTNMVFIDELTTFLFQKTY